MGRADELSQSADGWHRLPFRRMYDWPDETFSR